jgi:SAM-dependent methyltransferase
MSLRETVKRAIPRPYAQRVRDAFVHARYAAMYPLFAGNAYECPFCGGRFRRLLPKGSSEPVLREKRVVGAGYRDHSRCPKCDSYDRERHLYLYLKHRTRVFVEPTRLLHFAPEKNLERVLRGLPRLDYVTGDIDPALADLEVDITRMPFEDHAFDVILCGHILQDVPEDRRGIAEMYRVLRPGGWAIVQVPVSQVLEETFEDPTITSHEGRARAYGGMYFVRMYGKDFERRLAEPGFVVRRESYAREIGEAQARRFGLLLDEELYIATKPAAAGRTGG